MICVTYMPVCLKTGQMTIKIQDLKLHLKKQTSKTNKQKQNNYCNADNKKK